MAGSDRLFCSVGCRPVLFGSPIWNAIPVAIHGDEADCGLMSVEIMDEWRDGKVNWFALRSFVRRPTVEFVPSAFFQAVFGPNLYAHRLANVVFSVVALLCFYLFLRDLFGVPAGLIGLGLAAVSALRGALGPVRGKLRPYGLPGRDLCLATVEVD